ncbi:hypothetical protein WCX18_00730 [Sulfurimonas sp. HSL1-2]|uniref:hypothetical protein n=1 Tax=Thiomicrolovo zhangzhouensis TaxID=3131933 RepID=UPI0031F8026C
MRDKYFLLTPTTDTGMKRALVYYCLLLTSEGFFIFLDESESSPKSIQEDISAVLLDLIHMGVDNLGEAPILFKNHDYFDEIRIDNFGNASFSWLGATSEREAIVLINKCSTY